MREMNQMVRKGLLTSLVIAAVAVTVPQVASLHGAVRDVTDQSSTEPDKPYVKKFVWDSGSSYPEVREEFRQTYPFTANGRVSLENINGSVRISSWDRNEVQVIAVKRAYNRERLAEAQIDVTATPDAIRIKTRYPDRNQHFEKDERGRYNNPASVDYTVTVPRKARLESISLINGSLDIEGVEGDVSGSSVNGRVAAKGLMGTTKLSTVNGSLEVIFTRLTDSNPITLNSVNGSVAMVIPSNANAQVRASTVHGSISNDFGLEVKHGEYVGHDLYGQIGTGGPRIRIGNVNGQIWIKRSPGGTVSSAVSLLSQEEKELWQKDKHKEKLSIEMNELNAANRRLAEEIKKSIPGETAAERQARIQAQRDAAREIRRAQAEIRRAQMEIQREMQREIRREVREQVRAEGHANGVGRGAGRGGRIYSATETKSFPVTGSARVNVITYDGAIVVHGWDKSEVMYKADKRTSDEQEANEIAVKGEQQGSNISVIASSPAGHGTTNLEVFVPRNVSLNVSSGDGQLTLDGVAGDLTLRTGDGSVQVANAGGQLKVNTGDGPIKVSSFNGQLEARTGDGPINLDGKFVALNARTGSGSVTLATTPDASFTLETDAEQVTNEGLTMTEDLAPSPRVKRWKIGKGGKVFVISTGDGRVLLRQR